MCFPFLPGTVTFGHCDSGENALPAGCGSTLSDTSVVYEEPQEREARNEADLTSVSQERQSGFAQNPEHALTFEQSGVHASS